MNVKLARMYLSIQNNGGVSDWLFQKLIFLLTLQNTLEHYIEINYFTLQFITICKHLEKKKDSHDEYHV